MNTGLTYAETLQLMFLLAIFVPVFGIYREFKRIGKYLDDKEE